jgi:hypothetical protein
MSVPDREGYEERMEVKSHSSPWSPTVSGLRGRLVASAGDGTAPRVVRVELELENVSDVANPIEIYWDIDAVLSFSLTDEAGTEIETTPTMVSIQRVFPYWLALPPDSTLRIDITTTGYGMVPRPSVVVGLPHDAFWQLDATDTPRRLLRGVLRPISTRATHRRPWQGRLDLPPVEIP